MTPKEITKLLSWFRNHGIAYPWGDNPKPYSVWVSEIMLQQTVVSAAVDHFRSWMALFPDIKALSEASEEAVLRAWEGLGYYSRARNLLKGAGYIMTCHGGFLPDDYEALIKVPGIGDYTARAILSLAYGQALPVLDANVRRIGQRLWALRDWGTLQDRALLNFLEERIPRDAPGIFNCALMQLGQQICRLKSPSCSFCPLQEGCRAFGQGLQGDIPAPKKRKIREKESCLLLLCRGDAFLLQRREKGIGRGLWFIPACLPGEEAAFLQDKILLKVQELSQRTHLYTCWKESLHPRLCILSPGRENFPLPFDCEKGILKWIALKDLASCPVPSVYRKILEEALLKKEILRGRVGP